MNVNHLIIIYISGIMAISLYILIHKILLVILHLVFLWIAFSVFLLGTEIAIHLEDVYFMIGNLTYHTVLLQVAGIILIVDTIFLAILGLLFWVKTFIRIHMVILTLVAAFLSLFLCVMYMGIEGTAISGAIERYTSAFEKAKMQDVGGIKHVMKVERRLKCCGLNSAMDYPYGVLESCCNTIPPCKSLDIYKVGCAEALVKQVGDAISNVVSQLRIVLIFIICLLVYLFFFSYLRNSKKRKRKTEEDFETDE